MSDSLVERIHPPSPQRRDLARAEGRVARSHELTTAIVLLGGIAALWYFGDDLIAAFAEFAHQQWGSRTSLTISENAIVEQWQQTVIRFGRTLLPVFGLLLLVAVAGNLGQIGFLFLPKKAAPEWGRISPARGMQRIFSGENLGRLLLTLLRVAVILVVAGASLWANRSRLLALGGMELGPMTATLVEVTLWTCLKVVGAMLALGVLDYLYQRWRFEESLQMSDREMREETRARDGDPTLPGRRHALRQRLAHDRLARLAAEAQAVVTAGAGLAVAIRYDESSMVSPVVWLKGTSDSATTICQAAREHHVQIVDRPSLARLLSRQVAIQAEVPPELYRHIAEVLAERTG